MGVLHGLTEHERMLQLKSAGISDELLAEIHAIVPLVARIETGASAQRNPVQRASALSTPTLPVISVPVDSSLGNIGAAGGLS